MAFRTSRRERRRFIVPSHEYTGTPSGTALGPSSSDIEVSSDNCSSGNVTDHPRDGNWNRRMRRLICLVLALAWLSAAQSNPTLEVNDALRLADAARARGEFQTAISQLDRAFKIANTNTLDPASLNDQVFVRFAEVLTMVGDYREAA